MRRGALFIICGLLALFVVRHWNEESPLLIDGASVARASDRWCDFPKSVKPLPKKRLVPSVNGLDKPNGEVA